MQVTKFRVLSDPKSHGVLRESNNTKKRDNITRHFLIRSSIFFFSLSCIQGGLLLKKDLFLEASLIDNRLSSFANGTFRMSDSSLLKPCELKVPIPIIVIYGYFKCGLDPKFSKISHYNCQDGGGVMSCGKRMRTNLKFGKVNIFDSIDMFDIYTEIDAQENNGGITIPQWSFIQEIHDNFPSATWILNLRNPENWLNSIDQWEDLRKRLIDFPFLPILPTGKGKDDEDMIQFYLHQAMRIRNFVKRHPSHTLVEVEIDSPDAGQIMEAAFGISSEKCWKRRNPFNGTAIWSEHFVEI
jgi:hypothetical protein